MACEIKTRPMTPAERHALRKILARPATFFGRRPLLLDLSMGALLGLIGGAIPAVVTLPNHSAPFSGAILAASGIVGLLIAGGVNWKRSGSVRDRRALYEWELAEGVVTEFTCAVSAAIEIYEGEDERSTYLLQVDARKVLYLNGHYLYEQAQAFPAQRFRLVRAPHSWEVLTLEVDGPRLPNILMVPSTALRRHDLHDGDLLEGVIADFVDTA